MRLLLFIFLIFFQFLVIGQNRFWVATIPSNWGGNNWSSASGGAPDGGGPPTVIQNARFDANGNGNCTIDVLNPSISTIQMNGYTGTVFLNGNVLTVLGTATFTSGNLNGTVGIDSLVVNSAATTTFNGTTFGAVVNVRSTLIRLNGSTFNAKATFEKNANGNSDGTGGNVFNDTVNIIHSAANRLRLANTNPDDFNGPLNISNTGTGAIQIAYSAASNTFDGNVFVSSTSGGNVLFGQDNGSSILGNGYTISIGSAGFSSGTFRLRNFSQIGTTSQSLTLTGTALFESYDSNWEGDVNFSSARIRTRGSRYSGITSITKTGASNDDSRGGNYFESDVTFTLTGSGRMLLSDVEADSCDADLILNNNGSNILYFAQSSTGNYVAGSIFANNTSTGNDDHIYLSDATIASLNVIGNVTLNNNPSGTTANIYLGDEGDVVIGGDLTVTNNPGGNNGSILIANGSTSQVDINGVSSVVNNGSGTTYRIFLGNNGDVNFGNDLQITNSSSATNSEIYLNDDPTSINNYNGNILLEVTDANSDGIYFGRSAGFGNLASTKTITIGAGGFIGRNLYIRNFTQVGATNQVLSPTGVTTLTLYDNNWGGDVNFSSSRITTRGSVYSGEAILSKTGANDDQSIGGNSFTGDATLNNSGSGYFMMGNGSPDSFTNDLEMNNSGSNRMYLAYNSAGNSILGNLLVNNNGTGTSYIYLSDLTASTLAISGTVTLNNTGSGNDCRIYLGDGGDVSLSNNLNITNNGSGTTSQCYIANGENSSVNISGNTSIVNSANGTTSRCYVGNNGDVTINGNLTLDNTNSATTGEVYIATGDSSIVTIGGTTDLTNAGTGTTRRSYLGNSGDVTFNGVLSILNSSDAANSQVYCNNQANSVNNYNENITLEVTNASNDGIIFGNNSGLGTLAASKTITIGGGGYIAGPLYFRNFTQVGATAQTITTTGSSILTNYDSDWGGDVDFSAPRIFSRGTIYNGTASLTKTGATDDESIGGNTFIGDATLNNSGSGELRFGGSSISNNYNSNLTLNLSGSDHLRIAYNSAGNTVGGNLIANHNGIGTSHIYISDNTASTVSVSGNVTLNNQGNGTNNIIYAGNNGDLTINGNLSINNNATGTSAQVFLANATNSAVSVGGTTIANNAGSGTTRRLYLGNSGDVVFNSNLTITNSSDASNSQVYLNHSANSLNAYNDSIFLEVTNANNDGIFFGSNTGSGVLAAGNTVSIGAGGYIAGSLYFRNFTQVGPTPQTLQPTASTSMTIYDASWGGNVIFSSPRIITRGSLYSGTASLEKTGASDDGSVGGNTFEGVTSITNSGSGAFRMGNGNPDTVRANLSLLNNGFDELQFAQSGVGHFVSGGLSVINSGLGTSYLYVGTASSSTLRINGNTTILNNGNGSDTRIYFGDEGDITLNNVLSITNSASGATGLVYIGDGGTSQLTINGNTSIVNNGGITTKRVYFGNRGDITLNGDLTIDNSSSGTNSQIYCNHESSSNNTYNGSIVLTNTDFNSDGVFFGGNGGNATLAATETITIGGAGFIAGSLTLRNFVQVGATPQTLKPSGSTIMTIYDASWGGNVDFASPRIISRGTLYSGTAILEKTGGVDDDSPGGNTFNGNATLINSGNGRWRFGNGTFDIFNSNLDIVNSGVDDFYLATAGAGHLVSGDLTVTNNGTGTNYIYLASATSSTLQVNGISTINNSGSGSDSRIYIGNSGDITFGNNVNISNNASGNEGNVYMANETNSALVINGITTINNSMAGTTKRIFVGNRGDVTFNGEVSLNNSSSATNSQIYSNYRGTSLNTFNGNILLSNSNSAGDGILFGVNGGASSLAASRTIEITGAGFVAGSLYLRNFTQSSATAQTLAPSGTTTLTLYDNLWEGSVSFSSPRIITRGTTYQLDATFEKTGSGGDNSNGGNIFNGDATFTNSGTSNFLLANGTGDDFNGDVTYIKNSSGNIIPAYRGSSTYAGNINLDVNATITFAASTGSVEFDGNGPQSINDIGTSPNPVFRRMILNNANDEITLNIPINVSTSMTFNQGNLITDNTNFPTVNNNATVSGASDNSYVHGPIEKLGNDAFTFPVGDSGFYRPITISAPSSTAAGFKANYFEINPDSSSYSRASREGTLDHVSASEYWILERTSTTNSVFVTLSWDANSGTVDNLSELRVAHFTAGQWQDEGNGGTTGDVNSGTIISSSTIGTFSPFTLSSTTANNPLPIELLSFEAEAFAKQVKLSWSTATEINNDYFTIERSDNGKEFKPIATIDGAGNSYEELNYSTYDVEPLSGQSYYRLKQTDFDGTFTYSDEVAVSFKNAFNRNLNVYPNPLQGNTLSVEWEAEENSQLELVIFDMIGNIMWSQQLLSSNGLNTTQLRNLEKLSNGSYLVVIYENGSVIDRSTLVKQ